METRYISTVDLKDLSPAHVAAMRMSHDMYLSLCGDRDVLVEQLAEAPANSSAANKIIDTLSVLVSVLDMYEELHGLREAA